MKLGLLALLLPLHAHALAPNLCAPLAQIEPQVNYCDQNSAFVRPAQACRDKYKKIVKKQNGVIAKSFASIMKTANSSAQSGDFQTTQSLLGNTETSLNAMIDEGHEILTEVTAYQDDFVLPIYEGYEEDFALDPHSKQGQEVFRSKECYAQPMEDLDAVRAEVQKMVTELEKTRKDTVALHGAVKGKQGNLGNLGSGPATGQGDGGVHVAAPKGTNTNGQSSITGVEESKQKESQNPGTTSQPK